MAQHRVMMSGTTHRTDQDVDNNEVDIARTIIGMIVYMVFIAPVFSLIMVSVLDLSAAYILPVFSIFLMAGIYVAETYYCRNIF
jgi:uncharacterized membrane protein YraQ (UPF0718 family)